MRYKILVVEDFESIREFLCKFLFSQGYQVESASNGEEALEVLEKEYIDLVVSDYNMPKLSGMGLLEKMKKDQGKSHIPVIFLTTETNIDKMKAAKEAGLFSWITKPYKTPHFIDSIKRALAHGRISI